MGDLAHVTCLGLILARSRRKARWAAAQAEATTLRRLAETEYRTGLPNRREATARLERESHRSMRCDSLLVGLFVDLDDFKGVNDRFGHQIGDRVLERTADLLVSRLRSTDVCERWGGEEFLVALPGVELEADVEAAERLREALIEGRTADGPAPTASFGVTAFVPGDDIESW